MKKVQRYGPSQSAICSWIKSKDKLMNQDKRGKNLAQSMIIVAIHKLKNILRNGFMNQEQEGFRFKHMLLELKRLKLHVS